MRRAIVLSALGLGVTSPDPPVGCVILDSSSRAVGEGYHVRRGDPHAEIQALDAAGSRAEGGTAVITLEPCDHPNRVPHCLEAILDAGIRRVLVGMQDCSRDGSGITRLRKAGLSVVTNVLSRETRLVLGPWLTALEHRRPFITWVYAVPADGLAGGLPTGAAHPFREAAADAQLLRTVHDLVLSEDGEFFAHSPAGHQIDYADVDSQWEVRPMLMSLYFSGVRSLLVDGSLSLASPFLTAGLVDQAIAYVAGGGATSAVPPVTGAGLVGDFVLNSITRVGTAVRVHSRPAPPIMRTRSTGPRDPLSSGWSVRADWAEPDDREGW